MIFYVVHRSLINEEQLGLVPGISSSIVIVTSPQQIDAHSNKEQMPFLGILQANIQIAGPSPLVKSLPLTSARYSIACPASCSFYYLVLRVTPNTYQGLGFVSINLPT